jgi:hypothetical protein
MVPYKVIPDKGVGTLFHLAAAIAAPLEDVPKRVDLKLDTVNPSMKAVGVSLLTIKAVLAVMLETVAALPKIEMFHDDPLAPPPVKVGEYEL